MSVLIEGISVVVPVEAIERLWNGGLRGYESECPNSTFCSDGVLSRVGFMSPHDVQQWVERLASCGFVFITDGRAQDLAVVDQLRGVTTDCDWLQFSRHSMGCSHAWRADADPGILATPPGWQFEQSLSARFTFVASEEADERMIPRSWSEGVATFRDDQTDRDVHIGSPFPPSE